MNPKTFCIIAVLLVFCAGGIAGTQQVRPVQCWAVFDGNNKKLTTGVTALENEQWLGAHLNMDGHLTHILLDRGRLWNYYYPGHLYCDPSHSFLSGVVYVDEDCAGQPYIIMSDEEHYFTPVPWPIVWVLPPGKRVFIEDGYQDEPQSISYRSVIDCEGNCLTYPEPIDTQYALDAVELYDLEDFYSPPFRLKSVPCPWLGPPQGESSK